MRVLIVSANQEHRPDPVVPLGALYVAGAARAAGHEVSLHDCCFDGPGFADPLAATLDRVRPDVIGLSMRNVDDVAWPRAQGWLAYYLDVVAVLRARCPGVPIVLGGAGFTLFPEAWLDALGLDHGVAGEGERAFVQVLDAIAVGATVPRLTRVSIPAGGLSTEPATDLIDLARYFQLGGAANVQTRRGCAFQCSYCTYPELEGRVPRLRDPKAVVEGMERLHRERGIDHFFVVDNVFNVPRRHAAAICDALIERALPIRWTAFVSPWGLGPALLDRMARAGCDSVELGTDAAARETLAALGKPFGVPAIRAAADGCRAAGIRFSQSLILGGPGETLTTLEETFRVIEETDPTAVVAMLGVRLYSETPLGRRALAEGWVDEIGLSPVFYISPAVRDQLEDWATNVMNTHPRWYFPGLVGERMERFLRAVRRQGVKGPLWTLLAR